MNDPLYRFDTDLRWGTVRGRPNRFLLRVELAGRIEDVFLGNPGVLSTVYEEGRRVLCEPATGRDRKTDFTAVAMEVADTLVLVHTSLANDLFEVLLDRGLYPAAGTYTGYSREPSLPDHGRADFSLVDEDGNRTWIEVKSVTHVEDGIAKFPDSPTERGRRHVRSLTGVCRGGGDAHIVFMVQRPDAERIQPFRAVDPEFADRLAEAAAAGVELHAVQTAFEPPAVHLRETSLPIDL